MSVSKERLDVLLVERGLAPSREKAKRIIMSGVVFVDSELMIKAGTMIDTSKSIELLDNSLKYVSRGGYKLEKAIHRFGINLESAICADIGASTGGFTDCMLQNGVARVYAIDVGRGQLDWRLRNDDRVVCMEKTNVRYLEKEQVPEDIDFISVDVSFISLTLIIPIVKMLLKQNAGVVMLIKPQFEAGREKVGKKGIVRDKKVHIEVCEKIASFLMDSGFYIEDFSYSPIKGGAGNIEYLVYALKVDKENNLEEVRQRILTVVNASHEELS